MTSRLQLAAIAIGALAICACASSDDTPVDAAGRGGSSGTAGSGGTGGGASGAAGMTGAAGLGGGAGSGTAGSAGGTSGSAGTTGGTGGGTSGNAGATGAAGRGGGVGTGGGAGRGGNGGSAGAAGSAGGGTAGRGGNGGNVGPTGAAGQAGSAGAGRGGAGGMAGTTGQGGQGNLPPGITSLFPPPAGQNLCPDPSLKLTFSGAPALGSSGRFRLFTSGGSAVATVDMGAATVSQTIGGMAFTVSRPVYVDGNTVSVTLPPKALAYGMTYYVNVESGAISPPGGGAFSITDVNTWRFTTMAAAPSNRAALSVALDGSGSFCSVQGAFDLIPANNTTAVTVTVGTGNYHEIIYLNAKSNVTLQGQDRNGTVISGTNNNNLNPSTRGRALFGVDSVNNLTVRNLTIRNLTPQGGSQAEALRLQSCDKCVVRDATIISLQDTLLWSGRIYASNCLIQGNVDFVWGTGAVYFANSEIRTIGRTGYIVQARNTTGYGYVFVDCKLTADSGITGNILARIDAGAYPSSHVAYVNCQMSNAIAPAGWLLTAGGATSSLRFWEYKTVDASGNPINVSQRLSGSHQMTDSEAAMMRDPSVVLAGWQPPAN